MTSCVRIESRSIAPSVRRCTFPKALIDLMEPTLALPLPTFSSPPTTRTLCFLPEFTSTSPHYMGLKLPAPEVPNSLSQRKVELQIPKSAQNALTRRWALGLDLKARSRAQVSSKLSLTSSARQGTARVGIAGARAELHNTTQKDCCLPNLLDFLFLGEVKPCPLDITVKTTRRFLCD